MLQWRGPLLLLLRRGTAGLPGSGARAVLQRRRMRSAASWRSRRACLQLAISACWLQHPLLQLRAWLGSHPSHQPQPLLLLQHAAQAAQGGPAGVAASGAACGAARAGGEVELVAELQQAALGLGRLAVVVPLSVAPCWQGARGASGT